MKTIALALLALMGGCIIEYHPVRPKLVATFKRGDHVAYTRGVAVLYSARSTPRQFDANKGDTGVVLEVEYRERSIQYQVKLDKAACDEVLIAPAWEDESFSYLEAVVYPDPALAPNKGTGP